MMFDGMDQKDDVHDDRGGHSTDSSSALNTGGPTPLAATHSYYEHNQNWYPEYGCPQCRNRTFDLGVS